jgi:hypothetical protein
VERRGDRYSPRGPAGDDRGVLEEFFDDLFGDDEPSYVPPPPPPGMRPQSQYVPRPAPTRPVIVHIPQAPRPPPQATVEPDEPDEVDPIEAPRPRAVRPGPYRQPEPDVDAGSPF